MILQYDFFFEWRFKRLLESLCLNICNIFWMHAKECCSGGTSHLNEFVLTAVQKVMKMFDNPELFFLLWKWQVFTILGNSRLKFLQCLGNSQLKWKKIQEVGDWNFINFVTHFFHNFEQFQTHFFYKMGGRTKAASQKQEKKPCRPMFPHDV